MFTQCLLTALMTLEFAVSSNYTFNYIWNYEDETNWPGAKCQEGGRRQSPIDIHPSEVVKDYKSEFIKYGQLKFIGYSQVLLTGINNGHTIQFSTEGDKSMHPMITGGPLKFPYRLEQMHFHWLSEHAINGRKFPMEIHFVHIRADLTVQQALREKDGLAILSVFCNVLSELNDDQLDRTEEFMEHIPSLMTPGARISGVLLDTTKLLSTNLVSYFTYLGSLTSPECNEVVIWILFEEPIQLSDAQYRIFGKVSMGRHNFRSLQPRRRHVVYQPPNSIWTTPYLVNMLTNVVKLVTEFVKNVTDFMQTAVLKTKKRHNL